MTRATSRRDSGDNRTLSGQRRYESPDMAAFLRRVARAMVRRASEGDLEALSALRHARDEVDAAIVLAAGELHDVAGYSWTEIARELGITRQAARQRFGKGSS